jgi:hypothetical protein
MLIWRRYPGTGEQSKRDQRSWEISVSRSVTIREFVRMNAPLLSHCSILDDMIQLMVIELIVLRALILHLVMD